MYLLLSVVIGAFIGWVTNKVALWMLFNPKKPKLFGLFYGVIPSRKDEIAESIGVQIERLLKEGNSSEDIVRILKEALIIGGFDLLDVKNFIIEKIRNLSVEELEIKVNAIVSKEFKFIEIFGAILGGVIGLIQWIVLKTL